jgi:FkbM family methyltransferase
LRLNPKNSWTVSLARELLPHMTLRSVMRFRDFSLREGSGRLRGGELLELQMKSPVGQKLFLREVGSDVLTFQEVLLEEVYGGVVEHVGGCRTIVDLGANIGLASLYFSAHYPDCRIFAVEPNPDTYRVLTLNMEGLVRAGRCQTFPGAVWGSESELVASPEWSQGRFSRFAMTEGAGAAEGGGYGASIKGLPIDRLFEAAGFERVDLLKSDIEGAEVELFKGDLGWLDRVGAIAIEFHGDSRESTRFDEVVGARGFRVLDAGGHTVLAVREG